MATAQLNTAHEYLATNRPAPRSSEAAAEWVFTSSAMGGAVCGALTGVGVSSLAFPVAEPIILGTLGTILGSLLAATAWGLFSRRR